MQPETFEVAPETAYTAAVAHADRLTRALILSQAEALTLRQRLEETEQGANDLAVRVGDLEAELREARAYAPDAGGVNYGTEPAGGTPPGGEADIAHAFSD